MPWEKQFDVKETLSKAMEAFWARGFVATSMQDLVDTMGINRASIYSTYGDKRTLFIQALTHYDDTYRRALLNQIRTENTPRNAIMALFEGVVHETLINGNRTGRSSAGRNLARTSRLAPSIQTATSHPPATAANGNEGIK